MRNALSCLLTAAGLLLAVPAPANASTDSSERSHRRHCTTSTWTSKLKSSEKWIIERESGYRPTAANPRSSAFGIGQLILANRRRYAPEVGVDPAAEGYHAGTTDPCRQLRMMRLYIDDRYGSTKKAKKFWKKNGWY